MTGRRTIPLIGVLAMVSAAIPGQAWGQGADPLRLVPEVIPADIPHGSIETPIGTARWAHLSGDPESLPDPLQPMVGTTGLVWFDWGGTRFVPCEDPADGRECEVPASPRLWTSDDALSPRVEHPLPVVAESGGLWLEGDTFWLTTTGPTTLWRSADLDGWVGFDTSDLESPGPADLDWEVALGIPATSNGVTVVPVTYTAQDLGRLVGLPGKAVHVEATGSGRYTVSEHHLRFQGGDKVVGTVDVEETPTGIRFAAEDGSTIAEVEGAGPDLVDRWARTGSITEYQLGILEDSTIGAVDMPGDPAADPSGQGLALFPVDSGFLAFQIDEDHAVRTWRSSDGRTWTEGDRLHGPDGEPWRTEWVGTDWLSGRHEVTISPMNGIDGGAPRRPLRSVDGVTWTLGSPPETGEDGLVFPLAHGSMRLTDDGSWWAAADGESWEQVAGLSEAISKWMPDGAGSAGGGTVGDALFFAVEESEGRQQRDLWIIELDPASVDG